MGLIENMVDVNIGYRNKRYYEELGYDIPKLERCGSAIIKVKSTDVKPMSKLTMLDFICDKCGKQFKRSAQNWHRNIETTGYTDTLCDECCKGNSKRSIMRKYGVSAGSQIPGATEKREKTCLEKYGVKNPIVLDSVQEKSKDTCMRRYGVERYTLTPEFRELAKELFHNNGLVSSSKTQRHIANLIGGKVNELFHGYYLDILIGDDIDIEYDGSGHDIRVKMGKMSQDEFDSKERQRYAALHKYGIKTITIKGNKGDILPEDTIVIKDIINAIDHLNATGEHTYIIDYSSIR